MKMWIKFLKSYIQKSKNQAGEETENKFEEGKVYAIEKSIAETLITLGYAEETEEPKETDLETVAKSLETKVTGMVESTLKKSIENLNKSIENINFATPKGEHSDLEREYGFKDEGHFFKSVIAGTNNTQIPGVEFLTKAPSGQSIGNDPEGGFLVPEPILSRIWTNMMEEPGSVIPQTLQLTTDGNSIKVPRFFEASRKEESGGRNGGIVAYWMDEAESFTASKFTTGKESLELHKLGALVYATNELIADGRGITSFINQLVPRAINYKVAEALMFGTGVGQPLGVLNNDALIVIPALTRGGSAQANHTILHWNISQLYHKNVYRNRAKFYAHTDLIQQLEFMYFDDDNTNKRPVYMPAGGVSGRQFGSLYGKDVVDFEFMKDFGSQGDIACIDWSQYATLRKPGRGIDSATSMHVRFLNDEMAYRFTFRIDGRPLWTSPREDLNGTTLRSPFVTLASRTGGGTSSGL